MAPLGLPGAGRRGTGGRAPAHPADKEPPAFPAGLRSDTGPHCHEAEAAPDYEGAKVETREDEEQNIKLTEILELLVAAGYFRARIKGLSPFDKVVGGMTWCITTCSFDIDVDLLFQENSTIGQKIALTEKIVSVLPKMKCPHRLEPHQIQGLDFIHIFPVVQWLVKRAIETREEMGDYIRSYSISQFQKTHRLPEDDEFMQRKEKAIKTVTDIFEVYKPQRKYKRQKGAEELLDEESKVHATLLEYGRRYGFSRQAGKTEQAEDKKIALAPGLAVAGKAEPCDEDDLQAAEELRIKTLMTGMAAMATEEGKLTASTVGQIVGLQSDEIKQIVSEYAEKQSELSAEERPERLGAAQQHRRKVASLNKQILQKNKLLEELQAKCADLQAKCTEAKKSLTEVKSYGEKLDKELAALETIESQADSSILQSLRALVAMNENLKSQEQEFKAHCREEMERLQQNIENLKAEAVENGEEQEPNKIIEQQYKTEKDKLQKIRLLLARRNREIAILQRKIDEVPSRAELTQYQKRFIELYSQVSATHKETKQFFTLYNTLDDKKVYLEKEVNLLNSIHDNFHQAMASSGSREQFLRQMEQIVEGIKQNRMKMEKKKQENKMRRDQLNDEYLELLEKQRLYFKTVKEFKEIELQGRRTLSLLSDPGVKMGGKRLERLYAATAAAAQPAGIRAAKAPVPGARGRRCLLARLFRQFRSHCTKLLGLAHESVGEGLRLLRGGPDMVMPSFGFKREAASSGGSGSPPEEAKFICEEVESYVVCYISSPATSSPASWRQLHLQRCSNTSASVQLRQTVR
ncbi:PREDICTED: coiled-coil domain-containing protein 93 [Nipponia nippon]|uniref:coiled-coil domain-containing protein 93 n=2 Tax=Neoaves TaxID=3078114 RepID=UPI000510E1A4|nr:PREDICTED: coiled-coil domain-containing protein 93 [Nipponia nippon]